MTFCPSNERINAWYEAALVEIARNYEFDGYALTHARYCHPAFFEQMLSCGCPICQQKASELDYDFVKMKAAVLDAVKKIKKLTASQVRTFLKSSLGIFDILQISGKDFAGIVDWFNFRADVISQNFMRFNKSVHAARPNFLFGSDSHYPGMALLVGHRYSDLASTCDQILPLLSHNEIHYMDNIASLAYILTQWIEDLEEKDAVSLVYRLFGIDYPSMPKTIQEMHLGDPPSAEPRLEALEDIIAGEMYRARLMSGPKIPSYPVIKGTIWPEKTVRSLMQTALDAGHDGIVLQGTDSLFK